MDNNNEWRDWYDILRIPASASTANIHKAYRKAVSDEHPDTSDHPNAHERTILVNMAGNALRDTKAKAQFDRERAERHRQTQLDSKVQALEWELQAERRHRKQAEEQAKRYKSGLKQVNHLRESAEIRADEAEGALLQAEQYEENLEKEFDKLKQYADNLFTESERRKCKRYTHCKVCPESYSYGFPALPYTCYSSEHCHACFALYCKLSGVSLD